ncbi:ubiquitin-specific protease doa4 [Clydaea vesicula]|uniref:Ubiquitin-specific protease doa4 n=1 Tax=Clydaea vesicula TaxID=447962 RepID=A0AAD5U5W7_9FUNG|nr:ubiquitin-specific protease doa4 [Clydaea vesicula]
MSKRKTFSSLVEEAVIKDAPSKYKAKVWTQTSLKLMEQKLQDYYFPLLDELKVELKKKLDNLNYTDCTAEELFSNLKRSYVDPNYLVLILDFRPKEIFIDGHILFTRHNESAGGGVVNIEPDILNNRFKFEKNLSYLFIALSFSSMDEFEQMLNQFALGDELQKTLFKQKSNCNFLCVYDQNSCKANPSDIRLQNLFQVFKSCNLELNFLIGGFEGWKTFLHKGNYNKNSFIEIGDGSGRNLNVYTIPLPQGNTLQPLHMNVNGNGNSKIDNNDFKNGEVNKNPHYGSNANRSRNNSNTSNYSGSGGLFTTNHNLPINSSQNSNFIGNKKVDNAGITRLQQFSNANVSNSFKSEIEDETVPGKTFNEIRRSGYDVKLGAPSNSLSGNKVKDTIDKFNKSSSDASVFPFEKHSRSNKVFNTSAVTSSITKTQNISFIPLKPQQLNGFSPTMGSNFSNDFATINKENIVPPQHYQKEMYNENKENGVDTNISRRFTLIHPSSSFVSNFKYNDDLGSRVSPYPELKRNVAPNVPTKTLTKDFSSCTINSQNNFQSLVFSNIELPRHQQPALQQMPHHQQQLQQPNFQSQAMHKSSHSTLPKHSHYNTSTQEQYVNNNSTIITHYNGQVSPLTLTKPMSLTVTPSIPRSSSPNNRYYDRVVQNFAPPALPPKPRTSMSSYTVQFLNGNLSDVELSTGIGVVGLKNLGNTCFMNSILQCLCGTVPFTRYFLDGSFRSHIYKNNPMGSKGEMAESFFELMKRMCAGQDKEVINPMLFKRVLGEFAPQFKGDDQQDSHEFLAFLLDAIHEDVNLSRVTGISNEPDTDDPVVAWGRYTKRNWSIVVDMFQGQVKSVLQCYYCGTTSTSFNTFMYLSLPIPPVNRDGVKGGAVYLEDCFEKYLEVDELDGDDRWNCSKCKVLRKAKKTTTITRLPPILIINLKRFYYQGPFKSKIDSHVEFPTSNLDMSNYHKDYSGNGSYYDLYAISNHFGNMSHGHYTAIVKNKAKQAWLNFDDSQVSESRNIMTSAAYVLFYCRKTLPGQQLVQGKWWKESNL